MQDVDAAVPQEDADNTADDQCAPWHTSQDCCCEMLGLDESTISELFRSQSIPLVTIVRQVEISVTKAYLGSSNENTAFVAVSHVRSEGLGNSARNALPLCSLQHLQNSVNQSTGRQNTPFWIDTLCLPLKTSSPVPANTIRNIFAEASVVLVVSPTFPFFENAVSGHDHLNSIANSKWLSRLWTLQEGAIARRLMFAFGTSAVDYDSLPTQQKQNQTTADDHHRRLELLGLMSDDLNSAQLRAWKRSREWSSAESFSRTKLDLRKLLRIGYLCTPRFVHFASPKEQEIASGLLHQCLASLYSKSTDQDYLFDRLDTLKKLAESMFSR